MAKARAAQTLSRVDGFGLSVAALDMLFCALGAVMLIFAMQERAAVEQARSEITNTKVSALQRLTVTLNDVPATRAAQWAGVQALPAISGPAIFVLDLSGSLANDPQRLAQRHLVTQYVLQNEISDFAVVYFADRVQTLIQFGERSRSDWVNDLSVDTVNRFESDVRVRQRTSARRLKEKGIPAPIVERMQRSGLLEKLGWFDVISRNKLTRVGGGTRIDDALQAAAQAAIDAGVKPHLVLISDGEIGRAAPEPKLRYFTSPELIENRFQSRIAISLVDPRSRAFESGVINMERFVGPGGRHVLINGYGSIPKSPPLPERQQEPTNTTDYSLQGAAK